MKALQRATILNVNDHEPTRYLVTRLLESAGHDVLEAGTGAEALRLAELVPDLVVLDVHLPDMSGLDVCRQLKSSTQTAQIMVLQTSANYVSPENRVAGLDSGADGYLASPFERQELLATVNSLLRIKSADQALREHADRLVEADRRKDEFLAMLAHELRNPLHAISTALPLVATHRGDDARFARMHEILVRQTRKLSRMVDDLLDVSRITRGQIQLRCERLELGELVRQAIASLRGKLDDREQAVQLTTGPEALFVHGDATRLEQVLTNLLDNASKYSDPGKTIEVDLRRATFGTDGAAIRIRDHGIGISPDALPTIFDLFVQIDASLERSRGGMGIGLTLVRRLVELHGGTVIAHSDGLGEGSEFVIRLPLETAGELPAPLPPTLLTPERGPRRRVLVIEDNVDARLALQDVLETLGHDVQVAGDGREGLRLASASPPPEIALVDIGLPGMNGYDVAQHLRTLDAAKDTYLVALTGYGGAEQRERALKSGFDMHLVKPVDVDALAELLAKAQRAGSARR